MVIEGFLQDTQQFQVDNPEICGYLNQSEDNISNLLRRIKEDASPIYLRADQVLSSYPSRSRQTSSACFPQQG